MSAQENLTIALAHLSDLSLVDIKEALEGGADPNAFDTQGRSALRQVSARVDEAADAYDFNRVENAWPIEAVLLQAGAQVNEVWGDGEKSVALATVVDQAFALVSSTVSTPGAQIKRVGQWLAHGADPTLGHDGMNAYEQWMNQVIRYSADEFDPYVEALAVGLWQVLKTVPITDAQLADWADQYTGMPLEGWWLAEKRRRDRRRELDGTPGAAVSRPRHRP